MVCDENRCYPPEDLAFIFTVNGTDKKGAGNTGGSSEKKN
jgi:hypothetical protein